LKLWLNIDENKERDKSNKKITNGLNAKKYYI
jgi:hypothetical protein